MSNPIPFLEKCLLTFQRCFTRKSAFHNFIIVVITMLLRFDTLGVTSFIRALNLKPSCYNSLLHFFSSDAVSADGLREAHCALVQGSSHLYHLEDGRALLLGDGVKVSKEARYMPGVKKQHQESEDSAKPEWIFGHLFGCVSVMLEHDGHYLAAPLHLTIQDGLSDTATWDNSTYSGESHVLQMIGAACDLTKKFGPAVCALDRYFLSRPALERLAERRREGVQLDLVTRAKGNCIAYYPPDIPKERHRGRPRKRGAAVKLAELFDDEKAFTSTQMNIYGSKETISYLCVDLLWGQKLYQKLRFVLVKSSKGKAIFVSTDLSLSPEAIIRIYARRFKIEVSFKVLKHHFGAFDYHFWTKALPKLKHYTADDAPTPLSQVIEPNDRKRILDKVRAIERFVQCSCIAATLAQLLALDENFSEKIAHSLYLRTPSPKSPSEATVLTWLRQNFFRFMLTSPGSLITQIILPRLDTDSSAG